MERFSTLLLVCSISTVFFQIGAYSFWKTNLLYRQSIQQTNERKALRHEALIFSEHNAFSAPTTTTTKGTAINGTNTSNVTSIVTNAGTTVGKTASTGISGGNNTSIGTLSGNNTSSNETPVADNGNKSELSTPRTMLPLLIFAFLQIPLAWN